MPFTHVEIEERKTRQLFVLFACLTALYALSILLLYGGVKVCLSGDFLGASTTSFTFGELAAVLAVALGGSGLHWWVVTEGMYARIVDALRTHPPAMQDTYHARFAHIVEEVAVAVGGRPIQSVVIPTAAVNACAVSDFEGRAAIAVTEGALAVLNREQLEAVVGHEAAHIVSGDSLSTTVFCSLFALHEEALKRLCGLLDTDEETAVAVGGRAALLVIVAIGVLWLTKAAKSWCELAISREKEYRADAVAVRLTRNPLALAEALHRMSKKWRGVGTRGESLASLFIVDPGVEWFSEREGMLAEWLSTHPPTSKRIELLLGMAHLSPSRFEEGMTAFLSRRGAPSAPSVTTRSAPAAPDQAPAQWMAWKDGQWAGPFGLEALAQVPELTPEMWIRRLDQETAVPASHDSRIREILRARYGGSPESPSRSECPNCRLPLRTVPYEGASLEQCPACLGCYVDPPLMTKLFARKEVEFSEAVKRLGDSMLSLAHQHRLRARLRALPGVPLKRVCPRCQGVVKQKFYTEAYPVEVEQCWTCGLTWLDRQELEILQHLYERWRAEDEPDQPLS